MAEFMILVEKIIRGEKEAKQYVDGISISRSEIHLMAIIASYENIHISEIARKFNVTKGAVSKTVRNLEKKGLVEKHSDAVNQSRILIRLTEKGVSANEIHEKTHREMNEDVIQYCAGLNQRDIDTIVAFLRKAQQMAKRHL